MLAWKGETETERGAAQRFRDWCLGACPTATVSKPGIPAAGGDALPLFSRHIG